MCSLIPPDYFAARRYSSMRGEAAARKRHNPPIFLPAFCALPPQQNEAAEMKLDLAPLCLCLATASAGSVRGRAPADYRTDEEEGAFGRRLDRVEEEEDVFSRRLNLFADMSMTSSTAMTTTPTWWGSTTTHSTPPFSSTSATSVPEDCEAETYPPDNWECNDFDEPLFGLPSSHRNCEAAKFEPVGCATGKERVHMKCGTDGVKESHYEYDKGTIDASASVEAGGVSVGVDGTVEYEKGETSEVTFQEGAYGCGQCCAWWMHGLVCEKKWKYQTYDPVYAPHNGRPSKPFRPITGYQCNWREETLECTDLYGPSSDTCDREC